MFGGGGGFGGMPIPHGMMGGGGGRGGRRGGLNPWFIMMAVQLYQQIERLPVKPPVTLAVMAAAAAIHFDMLGEIGDLIVGPGASSACLSARAVVERSEWRRIFSAPLVHADEMHLVYNLSSFLFKGAQLETKMGSEAFAKLLVGLLVAVQCSAVVRGK